MDIRNRSTGKRQWVLAPFGLPFAGAGLAMLWFLVVAPLQEWRDARNWEPVAAQVLSAELVENRDSDGATYRAAASYRYTYGGNDYQNDRVALQGGSDNMGSFQQDLAAELQRAAASGEPYTVYVNPRAPSQSVANRELRTGLLTILTVFGSIFAAVGIGLIVFGLRARDAGSTGIAAVSEPWRERTEWASPEIRTSAGRGALVLWAVALFWCGISGVATVAAWDEVVHKGNYPALLVLLFDLVGIGLLWWAIHATIAARRFGELVLRLDPHPGSIGGDVGGMIDLPIAPDPDRAVAMTLSCQHVYTRRSGKNTETKRDALWSDSRHFLVEPTMDGRSRVHFAFAVPEGLPVSSPASGDYHEWTLALDCALPGVDLSRSFTIPVFATATKTRLASRVRESQAESLAHLETLMNLAQIAGGIALDFRAGRHWRGGVGVAAFGSLFAAVPAFMWYADDVPLLFLLLFGGVFGLVGLACIAGGLWMAGNRLQVEIDTAEVRIQRDLCGVRVHQRATPRADIAGIVCTRESTVTAGNKVTVYYALALKLLDGSAMAIGDGFRGYGEAGRAAAAIGTYTGLPFLGEHDKRTAFAARKQAWLERQKR